MKEIFLSASVPEADPERGAFHETANPFLIQFAVRELVTVCLGRRRIVWGGHPSITPMVYAVCQDFGIAVDAPVLLYQSQHFAKRYPAENRFFHTNVVDEVEGDRVRSLTAMREAMISRPEIEAGVFIGGMEGILEEHALFQKLHRNAPMLALRSPGGAAAELANLDQGARADDRLDFARLFYETLGISPTEAREGLTAPGRDDGPRFRGQ